MFKSITNILAVADSDLNFATFDPDAFSCLSCFFQIFLQIILDFSILLVPNTP